MADLIDLIYTKNLKGNGPMKRISQMTRGEPFLCIDNDLETGKPPMLVVHSGSSLGPLNGVYDHMVVVADAVGLLHVPASSKMKDKNVPQINLQFSGDYKALKKLLLAASPDARILEKAKTIDRGPGRIVTYCPDVLYMFDVAVGVVLRELFAKYYVPSKYRKD